MIFKLVKFVKRHWFWLIIILFFILAFRFFLTPYFWHFHDEMQPIWFYEWAKSFKTGQFPVRWAPDLVWSLGYPLFTFIYPLPYYIGGLLHLSGLSLISSFKLYIFAVQLIGLIFFNLTLFIFKKPKKIHEYLFFLAVNLIFLAFPYRALDTYVRGALGEIALYFSIPFWFYSFFSYQKLQQRKYLYLIGLAYGLVILSHNIGAYLFIPILLSLSLIWPVSSLTKAGYLKIKLKQSFLPLFLGLFLTAFFWLPALVEKNLMVDNPIFNVADHFPFIKQLIWSAWGYGASHWGPFDDLSFQLGLASWLALVSAGLFFAYLVVYKKTKLKKLTLPAFFLVTIITAFYLLNIRSLWLWQILPLMNYFQFPWRLLIILNFFIPLFYFFVFKNIKSSRLFTAVNLIIIILSISQILMFFKPNKLVKLNDQYFFDRYLPTGSRYFHNSEEYLRLPKKANRPDQVYPQVESQNPNTLINIKARQFNQLVFSVVNTAPETITIRRLFFPSWQIKDNGQPIAYAKAADSRLKLSLPPGQHSIFVTLHQTLIEKLANLISLISLASLTYLILIPLLERYPIYRSRSGIKNKKTYN
ncbi:MAG: hypothetical protein GXP43_02340 [bacterium]|nr:hypothetical protein [bacterium]